MAQAIYGLGVIVGPTLGPPLGGYIVENYSWPYIFYINIPIGVIATLLTLQFVRNPNYGTKSATNDIDFLGIVLLAVSVGSLQYVLEKGQDDDWFSSSVIVILTCTAFMGAFFFIWRELTYKNPIVNLRVLKNGNLRIGTRLTFLIGIRFIWIHIYHSGIYPKYPGLDGLSIRHAHGSGGDHHGISDARHRDRS